MNMENITTSDQNLSPELLRSVFRTTRKVIQEYQRALDDWNRFRTSQHQVDAGGHPIILDDRAQLMDLYESVFQTDAHVKSVMETLESQVLGERYMMASLNEKGQWVKDIKNTRKIQGTQFTKIIKGILESKLYGYTLIELNNSVDPVTGRLNDVNLIERRNISPSQSWVVKNQGQINPGWNIKSKQYANDYILIDNDDLGMLSAITPIVLAKKFTFSNFVGFAQTYGQPIIQGKTPDEGDQARKQLASEIANSAAQRVLVTGLEDEITIHALAMSNSEQIYTSLINIVNSEVSNLVLGSESMAGATQSYVGSTNAHQDVFRDRIEVYREFIENIMNEEVIPRLVKYNFVDEGLEFKYSNKIEMSNVDRIKLYDMLTSKYEVSSEEIEKEFGVIVGAQTVSKPTPAKGEAKANFLKGK